MSWSPATVAQKAALDSKADILFFGGSAGSLKTETMLMDAVQEYENPNLRAIIFRSSYTEMSDLIDKTNRLYTPLKGNWVGQPKHHWKFPSGAIIRFAYMARDEHITKYLGPRYNFIGFDESTLHTEKQVRNILGRLSTTDPTLRLRVRLASNPGNVGAGWHQQLFLRGHCPVHQPELAAQPGRLYADGKWPSDGEPIPFSVAFIPGKLSDHKLLDADYAKRLHMMSGGAADAMELGCWCTLEGAYFPFLNRGMIAPLAEAGVEWWHSHFISMDYGLGKSSASAGLYVRSPAETMAVTIPGMDPRRMPPATRFPEGRIRKVGEIVQADSPVQDFARTVAETFLAPVDGQMRRVVAAFLDPANFNKDFDLRHGTGGHSISDQIDEVLAPYGLACQPASNQRIAGWQLTYRMLRSGEFEITDACPKSFEALRTRMHDEAKPGDIKKVPGDPLDDVSDETRYALYSFIQTPEKPRELVLQEAISDIDRTTREGITSAVIRRQQAQEKLDDLDQPVRMAGRMRMGQARR